MRIFLVGMPGSGKSHWMRKLAHHLQYQSLDLDAYIEAAEQKTIAELFEIGENYFREKEMLALRESIDTLPSDVIIATGGGVPIFHNNMDWMKENGKVIYLKANVDYIFNNLANAYVERPLLQSQSKEGVLNKLNGLYELRKEIYQQAHHTIEIEGATISTFVRILGV
jgi:shikimate kinase